jgi:uncharacterized protein (TIGR00290 family)
MITAYFNWSGGKDSALALWTLLKDKKYNVEYLLTSMNSFHDRVSMHGVRRDLVLAQAASINIPLITLELPEQPGMSEYENAMLSQVNWLKEKAITHSVFGDIFLEDLKKYREEKLAAVGINCVFPIWKRDTKQLMNAFIDAGFKAIIVCVNEKDLDKSFCGREIDINFCRDLPRTVDPCGENGEFHTFVYDGPIFSRPIRFKKGDIVHRQYPAPKNNGNNNQQTLDNYGFYFCDLLLA